MEGKGNNLKEWGKKQTSQGACLTFLSENVYSLYSILSFKKYSSLPETNTSKTWHRQPLTATCSAKFFIQKRKIFFFCSHSELFFYHIWMYARFLPRKAHTANKNIFRRVNRAENRLQRISRENWKQSIGSCRLQLYCIWRSLLAIFLICLPPNFVWFELIWADLSSSICLSVSISNTSSVHSLVIFLSWKFSLRILT